MALISLQVITLIFVLSVEIQGSDIDDEDTISLEHEKAKYSKELNEKWHAELKQIEDAVSNYTECRRDNCGCYSDLIESDLATFHTSKVTRSMIEEAKQHGVLYQIINHTLYRQQDCMFEFRCRGVEHFILDLIDTLPDMEFIINTRDWPMINRHSGRQPPPVFSFSKTPDYYDITYPAWAFWAGGPAISLYPTGLGRWDRHIVSISRAARATPWRDKTARAFFRGSRTSSERDPLVLLSRASPHLVDAQYTKNQAWKSDADTLGLPPAAEVSLEAHCDFKYLFNFRGVAASFRLKHLFLCGSLVFHVGNEWTEFFYHQLKPWVHYVPVPNNPTLGQLKRLIRFAKENDEEAEQMASRGQRLILENLRMKDVSCYWRKLLVSYSKLLQYDVKNRSGLMTVPTRDD